MEKREFPRQVKRSFQGNLLASKNYEFGVDQSD